MNLLKKNSFQNITKNHNLQYLKLPGLYRKDICFLVFKMAAHRRVFSSAISETLLKSRNLGPKQTLPSVFGIRLPIVPSLGGRPS